MCVGVVRQDMIADGIFQKGQRPTRRRVVGVGHATQAERPINGVVFADDSVANAGEEVFLGGHASRPFCGTSSATFQDVRRLGK